MDNRVKVFWSFDELDKDQKSENYNFLESTNRLKLSIKTTIKG